jgi:ankyrin repeat protein
VACASGKSEETISLLIELGADVTASNIHDSSVYHLACLNGNDQILKELLYTHNITMRVNSKGYHPIHYAAGCKRGQFCLEFLISLNVDVNLTSFVDGRTPLHVAAIQGRTSCAQILYSNGK